MAVPTKDSLLASFSTNFKTRIVAQPLEFNLTPAQATAYTALHDPFILAYNAVLAARDAGTQSSPLVAVKDVAKFNLLRYARELYAYVQASAIPAARKIELGVRVKDTQPSPLPPPNVAPGVSVVSATGNTVRLRLFDVANPNRRAKPLAVDGASVFSFVGAAAPDEEADWRFEGNTTRTGFNVTFPPATAPGAQVWFTAVWFNPRAQRGPAAAPVTTHIPGGAAMAA